MAVGNLTVENNITTVATYDTKEQLWSCFKGASSAEIAGTVTAFTPASTDVSTFWLAGDSADGSTFVTNYDGSAFKPAGNIFDRESFGAWRFSLSADHGSDAYLNRDLILLVTGHLVIPDFGNAFSLLQRDHVDTVLTVIQIQWPTGQYGTVVHGKTEPL